MRHVIHEQRTKKDAGMYAADRLDEDPFIHSDYPAFEIAQARVTGNEQGQ